MFQIPCVIFAGGKSSRMGEDKALLPFADQATLAEYQLNQYSKIFQNVYISCKSSRKFAFQANYIEDLDEELFAPTAAFVSIFSKLQCERFFAISVDTPFVSSDVIKKIIDQDTPENDATVAQLHDQVQPLCGIYHISLKKKFEDMQKNNIHKLNYLLKDSHVKFVEFTEETSFLNLNNPQEYNDALAIINGKKNQ